MSNNLDPKLMRLAADHLRSTQSGAFTKVADWVEHRARCVEHHNAVKQRRADKIASGIPADGTNPRKEALRQEGLAAFVAGLPITANPHPVRSMEYRYWIKGWRAMPRGLPSNGE